MSLAQRLKLELDDGREIVTTYDGRDLMAWEKRFKKSAIVEDKSIGMIVWLGHHAAVRRGDLNGELKDYAAFEAICMGFEGLPDEDEEADEEPDPTKSKPRKASRKTAGDAPSSP